MKQFTWFLCFIWYLASRLSIKRVLITRSRTSLLAFYADGTYHRPIIKEITTQIVNQEDLFLQIPEGTLLSKACTNYIIQERGMNKNKNKRPLGLKGLNGHSSKRDSVLTSLQKALYWIHIINIIHNINHDHGIYNFGVHSLAYHCDILCLYYLRPGV